METVAAISGRLPHHAHSIGANFPLARRRDPIASVTTGKGTLVSPDRLPTCRAMWKREQWSAFIDLPWVEWTMFSLGVILMHSVAAWPA